MSPSTVYKQLTLLASSVALALLSCQAIAGHSSIDRVVAFGASLTDTGNAFIWLSEPANQSCGTPLNVPPYDALDDLLIPDGPYAKGGHHFSNGATWLEGLARGLALAGNARPAFQNTGMEASNYAVGGARAVANYPCRFNLPEQVGAYLDDFPQTSARTLIAIEIGGNDVRDAFAAVAASGDPNAAIPFIEGALGSIAININRLHGNGARKFLVLNVGDIGKTPALRALGPVASAVGNLVSMSYNAGLAQVVQGLRALPGIDIRILDIYTQVNYVVAHPAEFGFLNVTDACITQEPPFKCAKPDTYAFWDGVHPTKAFHAVFAQQAISVISAP